MHIGNFNKFNYVGPVIPVSVAADITSTVGIFMARVCNTTFKHSINCWKCAGSWDNCRVYDRRISVSTESVYTYATLTSVSMRNVKLLQPFCFRRAEYCILVRHQPTTG